MKRKKYEITLMCIGICCGILFTACGANNTEVNTKVNTKEKTSEAAISADEPKSEPAETPKEDDPNKENEERFYEAADSMGLGEEMHCRHLNICMVKAVLLIMLGWLNLSLYGMRMEAVVLLSGG